jgi:hypothetical protein
MPLVAGLASAFVTGVTSGNLGLALRAGFVSALTAVAFNAVGDATGHTPGFGSANYLEDVAGHALVGCVSAVASGGTCKSGAMAAGFGAIGAPLIGKTDLFGGTVTSSVLGGLGSVAGGGKFANGAVTGAFGYLFNQAAHSGPRYDKFDGALLEPGGSQYATTTYQQDLRYSLDAGSQYLAGVTVVNEDRGFWGDLDRLLRGTFSENPVRVAFTATIETAKGTTISSFEIRDQLPVGGWVSIPWTDFGSIDGPATVTIRATNMAPYYTGVIVGASRVQVPSQ